MRNTLQIYKKKYQIPSPYKKYVNDFKGYFLSLSIKGPFTIFLCSMRLTNFQNH